MNELTPTELKRPMDPGALGQDVKSLNALLGFLNNPNITGAAVPKGETVSAATPSSPGVLTTIDNQALQVERGADSRPALVAKPKSIVATKLAFSGRLRSGKDYVANAIGAKIFGFADPLYFLQDHFFGTNAQTDPKQKDIPGARAFLQAIGQWGWGAVSEKYPLTPTRACVTTMIRSLGRAGLFPESLQVDWDSFGRDKEIWVKSALRRIDFYLGANPGARIAVVNARFEHEFKPLREAGFEHYHVMCSPKTWSNRLARSGLTPQSPAVNDLSEQLAQSLDADVTKKISGNKSGAMLKAIWNDEESPCPSPRLYSLAQFLESAVK